jgi:hypothetical protein
MVWLQEQARKFVATVLDVVIGTPHSGVTTKSNGYKRKTPGFPGA